ncbi:MAG: universal stress protein [Paludibacteraceae bacterium]|nr:universal stress protein [Paludibacteraceae bacterium]
MRPIAILKRNEQNVLAAEEWSRAVAAKMGFEVKFVAENEYLDIIDDWVEREDAAMVVCQMDDTRRLQHYLNAFRRLRVPYVFVKEGMSFAMGKIGLPVTRYEEDKEKGPFCGSFARNFGSKVTIYKPKDYGTMAARNIESIAGLLQKESVEYVIEYGRRNSDQIETEAADMENDFLIISASRDYGWDDLIFGPKERKTIKRAKTPVMVINPRGDLYPLCN